MRPLVFLPLAVVLGLSALFAVSLVSGRDVREVPSALVGRPAPAMTFEPVEGPLFERSVLETGEPSLVNVFASWCGPCRLEHPELERLASEGVAIHAINYKDRPEQARAFLAELGNPFRTMGADPDGRAAIEWGVYGVPETFVVDGAGLVRHRFAGPLIGERASEVRRILKELQ